MPKVKIVQIAIAVATDSVNGAEDRAEYLDDQGRVWYQVPIYEEIPPEVSSINKRFSHYEWKQVELPDEPEAA